MSFSAFYAVRFSPAPELGEWLNVAVVGEGITEHKVGVIVTDSLQRIEAAFGSEAVDRVKAIGADLTDLVASMASAHDRGEETQPIPTVMRDQALSMSFSEQIVVFEGSFEDALKSIARKYLSPVEGEVAPIGQLEVLISDPIKRVDEQDNEIARIASAIQNKLARFSREVFPATVAKSLEQGQKAIESLVHGPDVSTILVIGGGGHLGSALLPRLLESGKRVRLFDPTVGGLGVIEILHPDVSQGISIAEVAKRSGVSPESASHVLHGATERLRVSQKTADKIREIAGKLGYRGDEHGFTTLQSGDVASSMTDTDVVIYIPDNRSESILAGTEYAKSAKAGGVKRFVLACTLSESDNAEEEKALRDLGDNLFALTILRFGQLYGHAKAAQWFGDLHDASKQDEADPTVNVLTAQAFIKGRVSVAETDPRPFLHVEDAATSILAILDAPAVTVNGRIYDVGSEDQICRASEIARLIKLQIPKAEIVVASGACEGSSGQADFSKIFEELGFSPEQTIEQGIAQLIVALHDGSVSSYMSVRSADPEIHISAEPAQHSTSEIQWESLSHASVEVETQKSSSNQSLPQQ